MNSTKTSRISKFYRKSLPERQDLIRAWMGLSDDSPLPLDGGLSEDQANHMIENVVGRYALPFGIGTNFLINNRDYLIPMVIEEPSVVAAVSNAARLFREGGGFHTSSNDPLMIGQIQILDLTDLKAAADAIVRHQGELLQQANSIGGSIVQRGGGAVGLEVRSFTETAVGPMLVVHLLYDTRDAMGANAVNTAVEHIAPRIEAITGGRVNLRILSNLTDRRKARAEGRIPAEALATEAIPGIEVARAVMEAGVFAEVDPYRAATHNKGIMNGIDAVVVATGNDWRAVEAGAHAYAARQGHYASLTQWWQDDQGDLHGQIELPLAVGIVGGATRSHSTAQMALQILDVESAKELSEVMAAVGLAQNFAALRALATDGIQRGHMRMHARHIAIAAGATGDDVLKISQQLIEEDNIRMERARQIMQELTERKSEVGQKED